MARTRTPAVTHPTPHPQAPAPSRRFLWQQISLVLVLVLLFVGVVALMMHTPLPWDQTSPADQQEQPVDTAPVIDNPPAQTEPGVTTSVVWPLVQVEWTNVPDNHLVPQAGEGLYRGSTLSHPVSSETAWAVQMFPELQEVIDGFAALEEPVAPIWVAVARDASNPEIVFAAINVHDSRQVLKAGMEGKEPDPTTIKEYTKLLLSHDREETWYEISLFSAENLQGTQEPTSIVRQVRVQSTGDTITLFAAPTLESSWRQARLDANSLPR